MKKILIFIVISLLALLAIAIYWSVNMVLEWRQKTELVQLTHASRIMDCYPDSALMELKNINPDAYSENQRVIYDLALTRARLQSGEIVLNDSVINNYINYSQRNLIFDLSGNSLIDDVDGLAMAYLCEAQICHNAGDDLKSSEFVSKAQNRGNELSANKHLILSKVHILKGDILFAHDSIEEAKRQYVLACNNARLSGNSLARIDALLNYVECKIKCHELQDADSLLSEVLPLIENERIDNREQLFHEIRTSLLIAKRQYAESLKESGIYDSSRSNELRALAYIGLGKLDSATICAEKCSQQNVKLSLLSEIASRKGLYKEALDLKRQQQELVDSLEKSRQAMRIQGKYDLARNRQTGNEQEIWNKNINLAVLALLAMTIVATFAKYAITFMYDKKISRAINAQNAFLEQRIADLKSNAETVVSQLHSQLSERDAKIDEMLQSRQNLSDYVLKTNEIAKRIELMRKMSDKKKITSAASLALSPQEIDDLIESFNFSYDKMPDRLREAESSLTDADIFLCCLVKMKVTNQDMAFLLNVSESALKKRKYRLLHEKLARFNAPSLESLLDNF